MTFKTKPVADTVSVHTMHDDGTVTSIYVVAAGAPVAGTGKKVKANPEHSNMTPAQLRELVEKKKASG